MNIKCEETIQTSFFSTKQHTKLEWDQLCHSLNNTISSLTKEYIWHRDDFKVVYPISKETEYDIPCHLISLTCFGDNIEDEWFIIYVIFEITKMYNDLIVQIEDNDGAFLLIEAADYLPTWINPETSENRVFIYKQHLHIIPPSIASLDCPLTLINAINLVAQKTEETMTSQDLEDTILKRICGYPQKIKESHHKAVIKLPPEIATILTLKPSLISPIVNTFCNLDALDMKHCKNVKLNDCINVEVTFTKFLYAMLMHTRLPNYNKFNISKYDKKSQLGLKLLYGYRTIMSKLTDNIFLSKQYKKFLDSLVNNGYFKDNIPNSVEYTQLLEKAKTYFISMESSVSSLVSNTINDLKSSDVYENTKNILIQKSNTNLIEDDDNWLNINPEELNDYLNTKYGKNLKLKNNNPITSHIITSELSNFLKEASDFSGIEQTKCETPKDLIDFDSNKFVDCLEKMLSLVSDNNDLEMNDSDFSIDHDDDDDDDGDGDENTGITNNVEIIAQDLELLSKLKGVEKQGGVNVLKNLSQSLKEEHIVGPASTILRSIGIEKSDILDSDDDD